MKHLDLFSGIGGFALAARWAQIETVGFCEIDPFCRKVLEKHWPHVLKYENIKDVSYPEHVDIMTAGFPCQPFSIAGKQRGKDDDRYLWPEVIRLIRESKPTWFIGENVPGIIPMLDPILKDLEREGYTWWAYLIPASLIGAPHKRERLWIIANSTRKRCNERLNHWEKRYIQDDFKQYFETIQSKWSQLIPESWKTFNAQKFLGFTADTDSIECSERTKNNETITERFEWKESSAKIGNATCNTDSITSKQTNTRTFTESKQWNARERYSRQSWKSEQIFNWEKDKPPIPGVDDGLPYGVDRNKSLGNAIVPQIPYIFMSLIKSLSG